MVKKISVLFVCVTQSGRVMSSGEHKLSLTGMSFVEGNVAESWKRFKQRLHFYFQGVVSTKLTDQRKLGVLMTALGDQGLDVFNTFKDVDENSTFDDVMAAFEKYCNPKRNTVYERFLFSQVVQGTRNVDAFVVELKNQASRCEFGEQADNLVRDRLVVGVRNPIVRKELLRDSELTLQSAVEIARAWERSENEATAMSASPAQNSAVADPLGVDKLESSRPYKPSRPKCGNCAYEHPPDKCPATDRECNYCKRKGHFAMACRKKLQSRSRSATDAVSAASESSVTDDNSEQPASDLAVLHICRIQGGDSNRVWRISIRVQSQVVDFKIDTGAECNVLTHEAYARLSPRPRLMRSNIRLRAYGSSELISPLGEIVVSCVVNGVSRILSFVVVNFVSSSHGAVENLIGLPSIVECEIVRRVSQVSAAALPDGPSGPGAGASGVCNAPMLREFADVFGGLGKVPGAYDITIRSDAVPVVEKPRRFPFALRSQLCDTIRTMERMSVIQRVEEPTDWVSNLIVVRKQSGDLRVCLDPRNLNAVVKVPKFEIPKVEDILVELQGHRYFTVLDLKNGFWQLELTNQASLLTTFNSPLGRYRFLRMCFGVSSAPEIFMGAIVKFFGDLPGVCPYFDDLIISGASEEEHDRNLHRVLVRARECNIRFNAEKIQFRQRTVQFLGFEISESGIKPQTKHVRAISEMPAPKDRNGVLRFLGMVRYLSRFVPHLAENTENLRGLTKKHSSFYWTAAHEAEFSKLKDLIASATCLKYYDASQPLYIQTDSSKTGMGCCLFQSEAPIAYSSRALTTTETRYAQIEKELLAVVYALEHFNEYTYGRQVVVVTDHRPLLALVRKSIADVTPRLQRLCLRLLRYSFQLVYRPGRELLVADTLSRAYLTDETADESYQNVDVHACQRVVASQEKYQELVKATEADSDMTALRVYLRGGWPKSAKRYTPFLRKCRTIDSQISFSGNLCFFQNRLFVPASYVPTVLKSLHEGHLNVQKTLQLARQSVFWLSMRKDIETYVGACPECNRFKRNNPPEPLKPYSLCTRPWERLHMDIFTHQTRDFLVVYDAYSYWLEVVPLRTKTVSEISSILANLFARFGVPSSVVSDNSPFNSSEFARFAQKWSFQTIFSSPRYPQSNGMAEKAVSIAKSLLNKNPTDFPAALLQYRNAPIPHIGYSPPSY